MIQARQYSSAAENLQAANDIRKRLLGKPVKPSAPVRPALVLVKGEKRIEEQQDHHVSQYLVYLARLRSLVGDGFSLSASFSAERHDEYSPYSVEATPTPSAPKTMKRIALEVLAAAYPDVTMEMLLGSRRDRQVIEPRQMIMYQIRKQQPKRSFPEIGRFMNRDHTVALLAYNKMKALLENDAACIEKMKARKARLAAHNERVKGTANGL